ncbi:efflux RND transporter periplasmic adaptor subunit [Coraliomargarita sp. SDUM461004]|uniref:Efflux RND transporter periplasmic adaptor subunit n=1 Tax=Thalassobacterium sedimentorum TaxID=3041258 RepID=A0ABU1AMH9_9BACT|nr:efflux RND transporter periplasmic adaptor subunit [Coraliomargarita sp. SDUM461004]MDQ8195999.1 efflux RND transporter periplasmic adaptor subunit [Coraliomargarita sp. SDUM461004]
MNHLNTVLSVLVITVLIIGCDSEHSTGKQRVRPAAPVEVAAVEVGSIREMRVFSGALEASASFPISPKVSGLIKEIGVDIGDLVQQGEVIATLDDAEYQQALAQAQADLLVARANLMQSESHLTISQRAMQRSRVLRERGVASEAEYDIVQSEQLAAEAQLEVQRAQVQRAESAVETARIQLGYTKVQALWSGDPSPRSVAERYADEGQTLNALSPLIRIVDIDPLTGVFFVSEKDYPQLSVGQVVDIETDAYPNEIFQATIERIAPVFQESSRQARIEITVPNHDTRLKPGMFVRAQVVVKEVAQAQIVPDMALVTRSDSTGIFLLSEDGQTARWRPVQLGVREGDRVQVIGEDILGQVIVLGQQLVEDGSPVSLASFPTE